ncbi:hypothetical protein NDU88_006751 [Pleurodeles waltl]|uniref:Reverse transcriptase n=1 Tax=Pleurodeles waltl TaxID=8319 RepID=A0AAV7RS36_PLEWA|nr:hypothetical protein NDU88_006751 [Pleurodeles waltl]
MIYTSNLSQAKPVQQELMEDFGSISGYAVNNQKTEIMAWNMEVNDSVNVKEVVKYLGIIVTHNICKMVEINLAWVMREVDLLMKKWLNLPLTIISWINVVKMVIAPKQTFIFNSLPLMFNKAALKKFQGKISSFIWASKGVPLPDHSELEQVLIAMMEGKEVQKSFLCKFGDPKFFKKNRFKILQDWAMLWYEVRKITRLSYYSEYAPVWDSPGSPEWTKDALAIPLKEARLVQWRCLCYNGEIREFENLNMEVGERLSKLKYLQMKSWIRNVTEEVGSTNRVEDQMQLDIPLKKEVARWNWLMMDVVDGEFNLPEEIWRPHLKDLWQVSTTLLYNTVQPATLRRNHLFTIHRAFGTPLKFSRLRQDNVVRCKKCGSASADDLHMFVDCPLLHRFWQEVGEAIKEILPTSTKGATEAQQPGNPILGQRPSWKKELLETGEWLLR